MKKKPNMTRLLILLVAAVLLIVYLSVPSVNAFITNAAAVLGSANVDAVIAYIRSFGAWAMVFSFCLMVFSSLIAPLPAFMITLSNAAVFGWWKGAILSWSSAMVGAALCFFVARGLGRDVVEKFAGKGALAGVEDYFEKYGTKTILVCRLLPFGSFDAVSYFAGLSCMFDYCTFLEKLDLSSFNTQKVTNMSGMFSKCMNPASVDVSSFNTSSVTDMSMMFGHCYELKKLDVRNFNTKKVQNMNSMFEACTSLETLDLSNFSTGKDTSIGFVFWKCTNLKELDIRSFDLSNYSQANVLEILFSGENPPKLLITNGNFKTDDYTDVGFADDRNGYYESLSGK